MRNSVRSPSRTITHIFSYYSTTPTTTMPRGVKKEHLPSKTCVVCQRPFTWRKKWEKVWDEVSTCSKSCNGKRRAARQQERRVVVGEDARGSDSEKSSVAPDGSSLQHVVPTLALEHLLLSDTTDRSSDNEDGSTDASSQLNKKDEDPRAARKAAKKAAKAARRAVREGRADPSVGQKGCDVCGKSVDLLIRCTVDASGDWNMVCGKCWHAVSGGVVDGSPNHPHYRYGGLWKNRAKR